MSGASKKRASQERIESLGIPKPRFVQWWQRSDKADWAVRVSMALVAALALLVLCQTWLPPFAYRTGMIPNRQVMTRVDFEDEDTRATDAAKLQKRRNVPARYQNKPKPLEQLRAALKSQLVLVLSAGSYDELLQNEEERSAFTEFHEGSETAEEGDTPADRFNLFKTVLANDPELKKVDAAVNSVFQIDFEKGFLKTLQHDAEQGNQQTIAVYSIDSEDPSFVQVESVQIGLIGQELARAMRERFRLNFKDESKSDEKADGLGPYEIVSDMVSDWIINKLPDYETLQYVEEETEKARVKEVAAVQPVMKKYYAGTTKLVTAGEVLDEKHISLLRLERAALAASMSWVDKVTRVVAFAGMIAAIYLLCGSYIFFVDDRRIVMDRWRFGKLLILLVATISLSFFAARDEWRSELIPLVLASIICAVVYGRELALTLMAASCICLTLLLGAGVAELVTMAAACTTCILLLDRIRGRTHLLYVGAISAGVTIATVVGVGIVTGSSLASPDAVG